MQDSVPIAAGSTAAFHPWGLQIRFLYAQNLLRNVTDAGPEHVGWRAVLDWGTLPNTADLYMRLLRARAILLSIKVVDKNDVCWYVHLKQIMDQILTGRVGEESCSWLGLLSSSI
jgi:hypothetical protein